LGKNIIFYWYINNWNVIATQRIWYKFHSGTYQRSIGAYRRVSGAYSWLNQSKYFEKISWMYRRRIRGIFGHIGAYQNVSGRIKVVKILQYVNWSVECISHANRTRTYIGYVSDTEYVVVLPNLDNIEVKCL
jgi:hypothetical protein